MLTSSEPLPYINNIGDELLVETLKRLPIKLAHRCKCVSKHWLKAISSEYFSKRYNFHHSLLAQTNRRLALVYHGEEFNLLLFNATYGFLVDPVVPPPAQLCSGDFRVLSCNNGLILCSTISKKSDKQYFVCNPVNKTWVSIPQPPNSTNQARIGFLCQAPFLSAKSKSELLDSVDTRCTFRIVRIPDNLPILKAEIYASEIGQWRDYVFKNDISNNLILFKKVFDKVLIKTACIPCNGLLYLEVHGKELIVIDPYAGRFGSIKFPGTVEEEEALEDDFHYRLGSRFDRKKPHFFFGECNGHLRCVQRYNRNGKLTIWELEGSDIYAKNWLLLQEVDLEQIELFNDSRKSLIHKIHYNELSSIISHPSDENIIFLRDSYNIIICDIVGRTFKNISSGMNETNQSEISLIVLPWWPLPESHNVKTENTFEALIGALTLDYSSIPIEDDIQTRYSDDSDY